MTPTPLPVASAEDEGEVLVHRPTKGGIEQDHSTLRAHAIVLTYRRWRLATAVVRDLLDVEGFLPEQVHLIVNGEGGLDDRDLEARIDVLVLPENLGASGGFRAGLEHVAKSCAPEPWVYVCEDDVALFTQLPTPRVRALINGADAIAHEKLGAIVAYGRDLNWRTGVSYDRRQHRKQHRPGPFEEVDMGAWGATLISRRVLDAEVFPDPRYFWGFADLEYCLQLREAGFRILVDCDAEAALEEQVVHLSRTWNGERPGRRDESESWCAYYYARNFFELRRRYGTALWSLRHLTKCVRRFQLAPTNAHRRAIVQGWWDGARGRMGKNPAFVRAVGELAMAEAPRSGG
jgi:GT2 family glycosyltransferase